MSDGHGAGRGDAALLLLPSAAVYRPLGTVVSDLALDRQHAEWFNARLHAVEGIARKPLEDDHDLHREIAKRPDGVGIVRAMSSTES